MRNSLIIAFFSILIGFPLFSQESFSYSSDEATWQLIVVSSEPACSVHHYHMVEKYNEITKEYLDLYKLFHGSYKPECFTEAELIEEYTKPHDLDLLVLVYDKEKGMADLHTHNTGGFYFHQGNDLSSNHNIVICDCPNFKYSDPVWILSHELSHFVLNYLGFDLDEVDKKIHGMDYTFDSCVEGEYHSLCSTIKTRIETYRAFWTVMIPYEPAIGRDPPAPTIEKVSLESPLQIEMIKEMSKWWRDGEISNENYIKSLKILSGISDENKISPSGMFKDSRFLFLAEASHAIENKTLSNFDTSKVTDNFIELNNAITKNHTTFSKSDEKAFLEFLHDKIDSWLEEEIDDKEFLSEIENVLDSPSPNLFLNHLENLTFNDLIVKAEESHKLGEYRNSLSYYDNALVQSLDSDEKKITALMGKGAVLISLGEYDNALQYYDLALEIEPDNIDLLKKKSFILAQLGLLDDAKDYFEAAHQMQQ